MDTALDFSFWIRATNSILAGAVIGLCLYKADWWHLRKPESARVAGLGLLCTAITLASLHRRYDEAKPWTYIITVALVLCVYGMSRKTYGEKSSIVLKKYQKP